MRPGLIRVDADELTYNFHIALRYEIEKKLFDGKLSVGELPSLWNETMSDYLGITPHNDAEGVLQDIHWSGGSWGYFPTYSLGNIISGMIWYNIRKDLDLGELAAKGNFAPIKSWLYDRIHRWGAIYPPKELAKRNLGEPYNPERMLQYLEQKYVEKLKEAAKTCFALNQVLVGGLITTEINHHRRYPEQSCPLIRCSEVAEEHFPVSWSCSHLSKMALQLRFLHGGSRLLLHQSLRSPQ